MTLRLRVCAWILEHVPEKWKPVFRKGHATRKRSGAFPDSTSSGNAPDEGGSGRHPEITDRPTRRDRLRGGDDGVGVDAVVPVEVRDRAGLAEMLDTERPDLMAEDRAEPGQRCRVAIEHADDAAMRRQAAQEPFDMGASVNAAALARPAGRGPAGIEPVGRRHGKKAHVAPVFRHQARGLNGLRCNRARIGNHHLAVGPRLAQPVSAVDDGPAARRRHLPRYLLDWSGGEAQIDGAAGLVAQPIALARLALPVALNAIEREAQNGGELVDESRLEGREPILRQSDQRL